VFVEERKKEVEKRCFGGMYDGVLPLSLGGRTIARGGGWGRGMGQGSGEHKGKRFSIGNLGFVN